MKKKRLLMHWIFSYLVIVILTILITGFAFIMSMQEVKKESQRAFQASAHQVYLNIDLLLENTQQFVRQVERNPLVQELLYPIDPAYNQHQFDTYKVVREFEAYQKRNPYVKDIYLYMKDTPQIISNLSSYLPKNYFNYYSHQYFPTYEDWIATLSEYHYLQILPPMQQQTSTSFSMAHSISRQIKDPSKATLMITFDRNELLKLIQRLQWTDDAMIYIFDSEDNIMLSTGQISPQEILSLTKQQENNHLLHTKINEDDYVISTSYSPSTGWKYVSLLQEETYSQQINKVYFIAFSAIGLTLLVGALISYLFSRHNYAPVEKLVNLLEGSFERSEKKSAPQSEYQFMEQRIHDILLEKKELNLSVSQQDALLEKVFLERLLVGNITSQDRMLELMEQYEIILPHDTYATLLLTVEKYDPSVFLESSTVKEPQAMELLLFAIKNISQELLEPLGSIYSVESEQMVMVLLNFSVTEKEMKHFLEDFINQLQEIFLKHFTAEIRGSLSAVHSQLHSKVMFREASDALEYSDTTNDLLLCYPINYIESSFDDSHLEIIYLIINTVQVGDYPSARIAVTQLFDLLFAKPLVSTRLRSIYNNGIAHLALGLLNTIASRNDLSYDNTLRYKNLLLEIQDEDTLKSTLLQMLEESEAYATKQSASKLNKEMEAIIQYVEENYTNPDVNVSKIALEFDIPLPTLSRNFKNYRGEGLLDYINRTRIERSKILLEDQGLTVKEIGEMVGFSNVQTFIRIYKRFEGITPGQAYGR